MKIEKFLLVSFGQEEVPEVLPVTIPTGSIFLSVTVLQDGIYLWYSVTELEIESTIIHRYKILKVGESIPAEATFVSILDTIFEAPDTGGQQSIIIFPLYRLA